MLSPLGWSEKDASAAIDAHVQHNSAAETEPVVWLCAVSRLFGYSEHGGPPLNGAPCSTYPTQTL